MVLPFRQLPGQLLALSVLEGECGRGLGAVPGGLAEFLLEAFGFAAVEEGGLLHFGQLPGQLLEGVVGVFPVLALLLQLRQPGLQLLVPGLEPLVLRVQVGQTLPVPLLLAFERRAGGGELADLVASQRVLLLLEAGAFLSPPEQVLVSEVLPEQLVALLAAGGQVLLVVKLLSSSAVRVPMPQAVVVMAEGTHLLLEPAHCRAQLMRLFAGLTAAVRAHGHAQLLLEVLASGHQLAVGRLQPVNLQAGLLARGLLPE